MPAQPFRAERYDIGVTAQAQPIALEPIDGDFAARIAKDMVAIDPWARLGTDPIKLAAYLTEDDAHCCRRVIRIGAAAAGVVAVRSPWLYGPYLTLLAVLPPHQAAGVGARVLAWMEAEVGDRAGNLWVCTSDFNDRALAFYQRHGFVRVGDLAGLVAPGLTEILLRKPLPRITSMK